MCVRLLIDALLLFRSEERGTGVDRQAGVLQGAEQLVRPRHVVNARDRGRELLGVHEVLVGSDREDVRDLPRLQPVPRT